MATTRRDIELLISAKETTGRSFKQVTSNIDALNAKIGDQIAAAERGHCYSRASRPRMRFAIPPSHRTCERPRRCPSCVGRYPPMHITTPSR